MILHTFNIDVNEPGLIGFVNKQSCAIKDHITSELMSMQCVRLDISGMLCVSVSMSCCCERTLAWVCLSACMSCVQLGAVMHKPNQNGPKKERGGKRVYYMCKVWIYCEYELWPESCVQRGYLHNIRVCWQFMGFILIWQNAYNNNKLTINTAQLSTVWSVKNTHGFHYSSSSPGHWWTLHMCHVSFLTKFSFLWPARLLTIQS